jgi:hypothetical protein
MRLDLDDALARAGEVRHAESLADHPVEPGRLEAVEPRLGLVAVVRDGRELESVAPALELGAALLERPPPDLLAVPEQEVERHELGRDLA